MRNPLKMKNILLNFMPLFIVCFCFSKSTLNENQQLKNAKTNDTCLNSVEREEIVWLDKSRNRQIPAAIYTNKSYNSSQRKKQELVIISPGYLGRNTDYSYIAKNLATAGYLVVTIQNDLPTDPPIPTTGNIYQARLPFWNTGIENILFVKERLQQLYPNINYKELILIGHSNGGDIAMLFATRYPNLVKTVISLDNRRVPFPKIRNPKMFTIRSIDQAADQSVLPTSEELIRYHIILVKTTILHNDMGGMGTVDQLKEINDYISGFLKRAV